LESHAYLLHLLLLTTTTARSVEKLEEVKAKCQEKNSKIDSLVYPFDFASSSEPAWKKLGAVLKELDIGVLVNNAGVSHEFPVPFVEEGKER